MASSKAKQDKVKSAAAASAEGQAQTDSKKGKAAASKTVEKADKGGKGKDAPAKKKDAKKDGKPGIVSRVKTYFKNVRLEVKRVIWPTKPEMVKYTGAVLGMLVFFGVLIALVDAAIVPALYAFSGLRG